MYSHSHLEVKGCDVFLAFHRVHLDQEIEVIVEWRHGLISDCDVCISICPARGCEELRCREDPMLTVEDTAWLLEKNGRLQVEVEYNGP